MSPVYIPYNFFTEVLMPVPLKTEFPFIHFDSRGFGFLWVSPLFFMIFPAMYYFSAAFKKHVLKKKTKGKAYMTREDTIVMSGAALSAVLMALVIFMIMGNGYAQFGARYTLDFHLMIILFMMFLLKVWRGKTFYRVSLVLLFLSLYINYYGAKVFGI